MAIQNLCKKLPNSIQKSLLPVSEMFDWDMAAGGVSAFNFDDIYQTKSIGANLQVEKYNLATIIHQYQEIRRVMYKRVRTDNHAKIARVETILNQRYDRLLLFTPTNKEEALALVQFLLLSLEDLNGDQSYDIARKISHTISQADTWAIQK